LRNGQSQYNYCLSEEGHSENVFFKGVSCTKFRLNDLHETHRFFENVKGPMGIYGICCRRLPQLQSFPLTSRCIVTCQTLDMPAHSPGDMESGLMAHELYPIANIHKDSITERGPSVALTTLQLLRDGKVTRAWRAKGLERLPIPV
jgi:hypothetical protein